MITYGLNTEILKDESAFRQAYQMLPVDRQRKVDACKGEENKLRSAAAGLLLLYGLEAFDKKGKNVCFSYGTHGKPYLEEKALFFSISHSGSMAVCSFSDREVGADVEKVKAVSDKLIAYVCTEKECRFLEQFSEEDRNKEFFRIWTAKESFMKQNGSGLSVKPKKIELELSDTISLTDADSKLIFQEYEISDYCLTVCGYEPDGEYRDLSMIYQRRLML